MYRNYKEEKDAKMSESIHDVPVEETTEIKRIDIKDFRAEGYLQEVNRQFLHPLGLALEVIVFPDGTEVLGGVWDYRDDPEGVIFAEDDLDPMKRDCIGSLQLSRGRIRAEQLGYIIQSGKMQGE